MGAVHIAARTLGRRSGLSGTARAYVNAGQASPKAFNWLRAMRSRSSESPCRAAIASASCRSRPEALVSLLRPLGNSSRTGTPRTSASASSVSRAGSDFARSMFEIASEVRPMASAS